MKIRSRLIVRSHSYKTSGIWAHMTFAALPTIATIKFQDFGPRQPPPFECLPATFHRSWRHATSLFVRLCSSSLLSPCSYSPFRSNAGPLAHGQSGVDPLLLV